MEWQPIETAPEEQRVLGFVREGEAEIVIYWGEGEGWSLESTGETVEITHWMPLPEPPSNAGVERHAPETDCGSDEAGVRVSARTTC